MKFVDNQHYGYTRITTNATTLYMEYMRNVDGAVGDSFSLTKWLSMMIVSYYNLLCCIIQVSKVLISTTPTSKIIASIVLEAGLFPMCTLESLSKRHVGTMAILLGCPGGGGGGGEGRDKQ